MEQKMQALKGMKSGLAAEKKKKEETAWEEEEQGAEHYEEEDMRLLESDYEQIKREMKELENENQILKQKLKEEKENRQTLQFKIQKAAMNQELLSRQDYLQEDRFFSNQAGMVGSQSTFMHSVSERVIGRFRLSTRNR